MEQKAIYVGIDVAKAQLDVAIRPTDEIWGVSNDEAGIRQPVSQLKNLELAIVLLEASGGVELSLVAALAAAELAVVRRQPAPGAGRGHFAVHIRQVGDRVVIFPETELHLCLLKAGV